MNAVALDKPTDQQIEEMVKLLVEAFTGDPLTDTLTGGIQELKYDYHRLTIRAAALEGKIFVIRDPGSKRIVSMSGAFGPGVNYMGSEAQRALGFDNFFESLPEDTKKWWKNVLMNPNRKKNPKINQWWKLWVVATSGNERGKGYGSSVVKEVLNLGVTDDISVGTNAAPEINVPFYESLGFKTFESNVDSSPFGTWVNTRMVWEPRK